MAQSVAWVLVALVTFQVAAAHPAHKTELRGDDAGDAIAQALAQATRAQADAESALGDVLQAAAIGDLSAAQDASDRASQAGQAALEQAQLARTIGVQAAGGQVFALGLDVTAGVYKARDGAATSIVRAFKDAGDELQDFLWRARENGGRLPSDDVATEIRKFNRLATSTVVNFIRILDSSIQSSKRKITGASQQIQLWEDEVVQAYQAAQAALTAAQAAQEANAQATTAAPTPAPTDAPTQGPTDAPTEAPTEAPSEAPTDAPTQGPTDAPSEAPSAAPTDAPTQGPTDAPTDAPSEAPSAAPTDAPTQGPTDAPTDAPTEGPTDAPTDAPTQAPTEAPTQGPTDAPTDAPTEGPTEAPTEAPTQGPTDAPTAAPAEASTQDSTTDAPVNIREKRSSDVNPFEAAKLVLAKIEDDYSEFACYARDYADRVTKDAFGSAAAILNNAWLDPGDDDVVDAMSKLLYGTDDILGATDTKLWDVYQDVLAALNSLKNLP